MLADRGSVSLKRFRTTTLLVMLRLTETRRYGHPAN
jgi:hypothetical protein